MAGNPPGARGFTARRPRKIFISYRRDDSAGHAAHLCRCLSEEFVGGTVFFDRNSIPPGESFAEAIREAVTSSDVLLALIGPHWLSAAAPDGSRRLDDPEDLTRAEIATALRHGRRVVPILVQRAQMPRPEDLPEDIRPLAGRQAFELRDERWDEDAKLLAESLSGGPTRPWHHWLRSPFYTRRRMLVIVPLVLLLCAVGIYFTNRRDDTRADRCWERPFADIPAERTTDLPAGVISHPVSRLGQPLTGPWAVRLVELDKRLGAVALRFYPEGELFRIEGTVDRECRPASFVKVVEDGIEPNVLVNWRTVNVRLGGHVYGLRLGHDAGKILATLNKAPDQPAPK